MTREEATEHYSISTSNKWDFKKFIDKIYDDFESRICENCRHFTKTTCPIIEMESYDEVKNPFGCTTFKRSEIC